MSRQTWGWWASASACSKKAAPYRSGLRQPGQDGVHTSRIPGLVTSTKGTLLALYDARNERDDDLQGDIDIAINRSEDGGRTWQPMQTVLDMKEWGGLPQKYNGVSDGCILSDDFTGDLYVIGLWMLLSLGLQRRANG